MLHASKFLKLPLHRKLSTSSYLFQTPHQLLNISPNETDPARIRSAYFAEARKYHPDSAPFNLTEKEKLARQETFVKLTKAYDLVRQTSDLYAVLGLQHGESVFSVIAAYHSLTKNLAKDRSRDKQNHLRKLRHAFAILSNPETKDAYDQGVLDINSDIEELFSKFDITNKEIAMPKRTLLEVFARHVKKFGIFYLMVLGLYLIKPVRMLGVQNEDKFNFLTEEDFDKEEIS